MGEGEYTMWSKLQARRNDSLEYWRETAEGLACDLDSAVAVMAKRTWGGADPASMGKWLSLNYGKHEAVVKARAPLAEAIQKDAHIAGLKEAESICGGLLTDTFVAKLIRDRIRSRINDLEGK